MKAYRQAVKEIQDRRRSDLDAGLIAWQAALDGNADLRTAYVVYQTEAIKHARHVPDKLEQATATLKAEIKRANFDMNILNPPYNCEECHDTGYIDGKLCKCVIRHVIGANRENLVLQIIDFNEAQSTAPKSIAKLYAEAEKLFAQYPDVQKPFFVLAGSPGTGKTVLAAAMATELMRRGAATVTVSAFEFLKRAKDYHSQFKIPDYYDLFTPMLDCDVLVIDDLGTEVMLPNITREYLYTVANERRLHKKITIITTNLTPASLLERYGEAIFSRLCDKSVSNTFSINAENKRLK